MIIPLLRVENEFQANDIATEIGRLGAAGVPALVERLDDPDPKMRKAASDALDFSVSAIRERGEDASVLEPAVDPLIHLLSDPEAEVRSTAIDTLGSMREPRAREALLGLLGDPDPTVREVLARVLSYFGEESLQGVESTFRNGFGLERLGAAETLAAFDTYAGLAGDGSDSEEIKRLGAEAESVLDAAVQQGDPAVVGAYVYFIRHGRSDAIGVLIAGLNTYGDEKLAERFLNAGNSTLHDAAEAWAAANGFTVSTSSQSNGTYQWGSAQ